MKLVKGEKYRIQYFPAGTRKPYEMVAEYMGEEFQHGQKTRHYFSLRPAAGTTYLTEDQIISTMKTEDAIRQPRKM